MKVVEVPPIVMEMKGKLGPGHGSDEVEDKLMVEVM